MMKIHWNEKMIELHKKLDEAIVQENVAYGPRMLQAARDLRREIVAQIIEAAWNMGYSKGSEEALDYAAGRTSTAVKKKGT